MAANKNYLVRLLPSLLIALMFTTACRPPTASMPHLQSTPTLPLPRASATEAAPERKPNPAPLAESTVAPVTRPAKLDILRLDSDRFEVVEGEKVRVQLTVKNTGEAPGDFGVSLMQGSIQAATFSVHLEGGETRTLGADLTMNESGTKELRAGYQSVWIDVLRPASFATGELSLSRPLVAVGEEAVVAIDVTNDGEVTGNYSGAFNVEGQAPIPVAAIIGPGETATFTGKLVKSEPGRYKVAFGDKQAQLRVLKPALFTVGALTLSKSRIAAGEKATASIEVTNQGEVGGAYAGVFQVQGQAPAPITAVIQAGETERLRYQILSGAPGDYRVTFGERQAELTVFQPVSLRLDMLKLSKTSADVGEDITTYIDVTNVGEVSGDYSGKLELGAGRGISVAGTITPGQTKRFSYTFSMNAPGQYKLKLGTLETDLSIGNELLRTVAWQYQNADPRQIEFAPGSWRGKAVVVSGLIANPRFNAETGQTEAELGADLPGSLYRTVSLIVHVPGQIEWLYPGARAKLFGRVSGTEKAASDASAGNRDLPVLTADYVLESAGPEQPGGTRLNPMGFGRALDITQPDGRTMRVTLQQVSRGEEALMMMKIAGISDSRPGPGRVWYTMLAQAENASGIASSPIDPYDYGFSIFSSDGVDFGRAGGIVPEADSTRQLYPGEMGKWRLVLEGPPDDENPVVRFTFGKGREGWLALFTS